VFLEEDKTKASFAPIGGQGGCPAYLEGTDSMFDLAYDADFGGLKDVIQGAVPLPIYVFLQ
jgi:hypothetical protein